MTEKRYVSATETAKLIRRQLKKRHPDTKFSVRSGHDSINIGWIDGPLTSEVDDELCGFKGGGFDGMIDMAYYSDSWLMPDGTACFASTTGTEGSRGTVPADDTAKPHASAERVRFGAKYIFTSRESSPAAWWDAAKLVAGFWDFDPTASPVNVWIRDYGAKMFRVPLAHGYETDFHVENANEWANLLVHRELARPEIEDRIARFEAREEDNAPEGDGWGDWEPGRYLPLKVI